MAKPTISFTVEPVIAGKLMFLQQAPSFKGGTPRAKVIVSLRIKNNSGKKQRIGAIAFHYPGSSREPDQMKYEYFSIVPDDLADDKSAIDNKGFINPGKTAGWSNGVVNLDESDDPDTHENHVYIEGKVPKKISIHVKCDGSAKVFKKDFTLAPYIKPVKEGAFLFPFSVADLKDGEYFVTKGKHWANGGASGVQIYAHDISLQGSHDGDDLSPYLRGIEDPFFNDQFRIYGIPVRAMADGIVTESVFKNKENEYTGDFPKGDPDSNHIWIKHGTIYAYYTHFQKNSIPAHLRITASNPAPVVKVGEMIGLAGNSGNAQGPHTHIHVTHGGQDKQLRPIPFRNAWVLDKDESDPPEIDDDWVRLDAEGIPMEEVAIWPASTMPGFKIPTAGLAVAGNWSETFWKSNTWKDFTKKTQELINSGKRITYLCSFVEQGHRRWVGVYRPGTYGITMWVSTGYNAFKKRADKEEKDKGRKLVHAHAFHSGSVVKWVGIARSGVSTTKLIFEKNFDDFSAKVNTLAKAKDKRTLVHVSNILKDGTRYWFGIARKENYTTKLFWNTGLDDFKKKIDSLAKNGRKVIHAFPYIVDGKHKWIGISRESNVKTVFWQNSNFDSFKLARVDQHAEGRRLMAFEFIH